MYHNEGSSNLTRQNQSLNLENSSDGIIFLTLMEDYSYEKGSDKYQLQGAEGCLMPRNFIRWQEKGVFLGIFFFHAIAFVRMFKKFSNECLSTNNI